MNYAPIPGADQARIDKLEYEDAVAVSLTRAAAVADLMQAATQGVMLSDETRAESAALVFLEIQAAQEAFAALIALDRAQAA